MRELPILRIILHTCKVKITTYFANIQKSAVEMQHVRVGHHNNKMTKFIYATECIEITRLVLILYEIKGTMREIYIYTHTHTLKFSYFSFPYQLPDSLVVAKLIFLC